MANASSYVGPDSLAQANQTLTTARFASRGTRERVLQGTRKSFYLTCLSWQQQARGISFWCNPSSIQWNFKLRAPAPVKTKGGTVSYIWRSSNTARGSLGFFDEPVATFTFQTGNLMPVRRAQTPLPSGLLDLYEFLELMNEPLVLDNGGMNYRLIYYNSLAFPDLLLVGFFDPSQDLSFTEAAEDPAQIQWTAPFIIRRTAPEFHNAAQLATAFINADAGFNNVAAQNASLGTNGTSANSGQFGADGKDSREGSIVGVSATETDLRRNEAPPAAPLAPGIGTAKNLGSSLRGPQRTT